MKLEVMLSVMNLKKSDLDKMNITRNFNIYSYNELGIANSRNKALELVTEDIIVICDDDVIYTDTYEIDIINEFKNNPKADVIFFNMYNPYRNKRINKKRKRVHFYNAFNYASYNIAFRREKFKDIKVNTSFGPGSKYKIGDDTILIKDFLKHKLKIYTSPIFIGTITSDDSTWFKGYDENKI